jgi:hypothetical protein
VLRFAADGAPVGEAARVNTTAAGFQKNPVAAALADGAVVVWSERNGPGAAARDGLWLRRYDATGAALGGAVQVDPGAGVVGFQRIAAGEDGGFAVSWEDDDGSAHGVFARAFAADGTARGERVRLNPDVADSQRLAALAPRAGGGFLAVWQGATGEAKRKAIYGRFLDADGALDGDRFRISAGAGYAQLAPSVAATPGGGFLVTWIDYRERGVFNRGYGITGVELDLAGATVGDEVWFTDRKIRKTNGYPLVGDGAGEFLLVWQGFRGVGTEVVWARRLSAD